MLLPLDPAALASSPGVGKHIGIVGEQMPDDAELLVKMAEHVALLMVDND